MLRRLLLIAAAVAAVTVGGFLGQTTKDAAGQDTGEEPKKDGLIAEQKDDAAAYVAAFLKLQQTDSDWKEDMEDTVAIYDAVLKNLQERVKALEEHVPPPPPPPEPTVGTLVPGTDLLAEPATPEATEPVNAEFPITADTRTVTLKWGASEMPLNFYDNSDSGPIPRVMKFSLDGGPWLGSRSGIVRIPDDLPDGTHRLRFIMYPNAVGTMSIPLKTSTVTKLTVEGVALWGFTN